MKPQEEKSFLRQLMTLLLKACFSSSKCGGKKIFTINNHCCKSVKKRKKKTKTKTNNKTNKETNKKCKPILLFGKHNL